MRGQHFGFLGTLSVVWIASRVGFMSIVPTAATPMAEPPNLAVAPVKSFIVNQPCSAPSPDNVRSLCCPAFFAPARYPAISPSVKRPDFQIAKTAADGFAPPQILMAPASSSLQLFDSPPLPLAPRANHQKFSLYAFSFFRANSQGGVLLNGAQYGGSQSGVVATYAIARFQSTSREPKMAFLFRGAVAHDNLEERELAAGLRWRPARQIPVTLTLERRFRNERSDAIAVYLAGGQSAFKLPLQFRLDSFAQAGVVSGKGGGPFFDIATRAERTVADIGTSPIKAGVGVWGGGQKDIFRIDVGPTISTELPIGTARMLVSADWRFRIAGDATPTNGPALTLSTSF